MTKENIWYRQCSDKAVSLLHYWISRERVIGASSNRLNQTLEFIAEQAAHNARVAITMDRLVQANWTFANERQAEGRFNR